MYIMQVDMRASDIRVGQNEVGLIRIRFIIEIGYRFVGLVRMRFDRARQNEVQHRLDASRYTMATI